MALEAAAILPSSLKHFEVQASTDLLVELTTLWHWIQIVL